MQDGSVHVYVLSQIINQASQIFENHNDYQHVIEFVQEKNSSDIQISQLGSILKNSQLIQESELKLPVFHIKLSRLFVQTNPEPIFRYKFMRISKPQQTERQQIFSLPQILPLGKKIPYYLATKQFYTKDFEQQLRLYIIHSKKELRQDQIKEIAGLWQNSHIILKTQGPTKIQSGQSRSKIRDSNASYWISNYQSIKQQSSVSSNSKQNSLRSNFDSISRSVLQISVSSESVDTEEVQNLSKVLQQTGNIGYYCGIVILSILVYWLMHPTSKIR